MAAGDRRFDKKRLRVKDATILYEEAKLLSFLRRKAATSRTFPLVDLSAGGAQFVSREALPRTQPLFITMKVPAFLEPIEMKAVVSWCRPVEARKGLFRVGVKFTGRPPAQLARLLSDEDLRFRERGKYLD